MEGCKQKPIAVVYFHPLEKGVALAMGDRRLEHPFYLFFSPNLWYFCIICADFTSTRLDPWGNPV